MIELPEDPADAVTVLRDASQKAPVVVLKKSPTCPISNAAESRFYDWLETTDPGLEAIVIDVLSQKTLARGITAHLDVSHASPQVLVFRDGEVADHTSHGAIDGAWLDAAVGA